VLVVLVPVMYGMDRASEEALPMSGSRADSIFFLIYLMFAKVIQLLNDERAKFYWTKLLKKIVEKSVSIQLREV